MKKLLRIIGIFTLIMTSTNPITACVCNETSIANLTTVLINRDLGIIYVGKADEPNETQIKSALVANGKNPDLDPNAIVISDITATTSKVVGNGTKYSIVPIEINFTINNFIDITGNIIGAIKCSCKDTDGDIYLGTETNINAGKLYRKRKSEITFKDITRTSISGAVLSLLDTNDTMYVGTKTSIDTGKLYRKIKNAIRNDFIDITGRINGSINILSLGTNGNIYVGTGIQNGVTGILYKSTDGANFTEF